MKKEEFRDIKGYEGLYQVSNIGRVKSFKGDTPIVLRAGLSGKYLMVVLHKDGTRKSHGLHKLVAMSFLNHTPNGHTIVVDHIDNDQLNNNLTNLQLISNRENLLKDRKMSSEYKGVSLFKRDNKWRADITIQNKLKFLGLFVNEIDAHYAYQEALRNI